MKPVLVLLAVLGLPLAVQAQPSADDGKSTDVSELVVRARKATAVSGLAVMGDCPVPRELDRGKYGVQFDAPSDTEGTRTEESPGTRAFILREISDFRSGTPDYAHMGFLMAGVTRESLPKLKRWVICRGAFKDIKFLHVSQKGNDDFEVDFSNGAIEWEVQPPVSGVVRQAALRVYYPQPETGRLADFLDSLAVGEPDYSALTPALASAVRAEWPTLRKALDRWGHLDSFVFLRQADDGAYHYVVGFEHRKVVWEVGPLDGSGKITGLKYDDGSN